MIPKEKSFSELELLLEGDNSTTIAKYLCDYFYNAELEDLISFLKEEKGLNDLDEDC